MEVIMSPSAAEMLLTQILPILQVTVPRVVRPVGAEDSDELVQDAAAMAAQMVDTGFIPIRFQGFCCRVPCLYWFVV